jgi:U6 snRNA-associated Sm-like protein LSm6
MEQPPAESVPPEAARDDEVRCFRCLVTTDDCGLPDLGFQRCSQSMVVVTATYVCTAHTRLLSSCDHFPGSLVQGATASSAAQGPSHRSPSHFLKSALGRPVRVKLNSGIEYRGIMVSLDGYLNLALEQCEEYDVHDQLKAVYGDSFIRGNNGT